MKHPPTHLCLLSVTLSHYLDMFLTIAVLIFLVPPEGGRGRRIGFPADGHFVFVALTSSTVGMYKCMYICTDCNVP